MLDILSGYEIGDATWAPPPSEPFAQAAERDPGRLKIGYTLEAAMEAPLDPECERATLEAAQLLTELGHDVEEIEAPWGGQDLFEAFIMAFGTPISMGMYFGGMVTGREPTEELVEPLSWTMWNAVRERSALDYLLARTQLSAVSRGHHRALGELRRDPHARPSPHGRCGSARSTRAATTRGTTSSAAAQFTPYAAIFNVTGQPAISLPLFHGDDGLPTAVQLARPPGGRGGRCSAWPRSSRRRARGPTAGPSCRGRAPAA